MLAKIATVIAATILVTTSVIVGTVSVAQATPPHAQIEGSGSSWAANAVNQWIADVNPRGLRVVYTPSGSTQGRRDFAFRTTDFAVTDLGYQGTDQFGGSDTSQRPYAYVPFVAGGTSFPYQLKVDGQLVRDLQLSGLTLAKIFTQQITDWSDPAITADNNGRALPSLPIIPVIHSEGSGTTAQFTGYLDTQYPDMWRPFQGTPGMTEFYPSRPGLIAQNGSDGVMNFIASTGANGAIGYDEYSYALARNYPVAKIGNAAGSFVAPTPQSVSVALSQAIINNDPASLSFGTADLHNVYTNPDPLSYPLSSYNYLIIPTAANDLRMTTAKRQTLLEFGQYGLCAGQAGAGPIGYAPLPGNLVLAGLTTLGLLKTADPQVDSSSLTADNCASPGLGERTTTSLAVSHNGISDHGLTLSTAVVNISNPGAIPSGTVSWYDNDSSTPLNASPVALNATGHATFDLPAGLTAGPHSIVATFTATDPALYPHSSSTPVAFSLAAAGSPCADRASQCTDPQTLITTVDTGTLVISTPYTPASPFDLGHMSLDPTGRYFHASAPFGSVANPNAGVTITDTRVGDLPWTASAYAGDFVSGVNKINGQNLGFKNVTVVPVAGNALATGAKPVNAYNAPNGSASNIYGVNDPGTNGLKGSAGGSQHIIATAAHGIGTVNVVGTMELFAPTSTQAGTYVNTVTFTIA